MNYTGIADIGNELIRILRKAMVPEVMSTGDHIGLCSPEDHGDYELGLFLYEITESSEVRINNMYPVSSSQMQYPPTALTLYYMITAYSNSDLPYRAETEHRLLGKTVQVFADQPVMEKFEDKATGYVPVIRMNNKMSLDDKTKAWSAPNKGMKASLFYQVGPVMISSGTAEQTVRVREGVYSVQEA